MSTRSPGINKMPSGRYLARFKDQRGQKRAKAFDTEGEARTWRAEQLQAVGKGVYMPPEEIKTFEEFAAVWLKSMADTDGKHGKRKESTLEGWQVHVNHLNLVFGPIKLDKLTTPFIQSKLSEIGEENLGPKTQNKCLTTLGNVLGEAVRMGQITSNPARSVKRLATGSGGVFVEGEEEEREGLPVPRSQVYTSAELAKLLSAPEPGSMESVMLHVAVLTGARHGELLGLRPEDVNFEKRRLEIVRTFPDRWKDSVPVFFTPKTKTSRRSIPLPGFLLAMLRKWIVQAPPSPEFKCLFCDQAGRPLRRKAVLRDVLYAAIEKAGITKMHGLRHSYATEQLTIGVPLNVVSGRLGHASVDITAKTYCHFIETEQDDSDAERLADRIFSNREALGQYGTVKTGAEALA